jgi:L-aspartate oxidase
MTHHFDFLVVGSGIAGLSYALKIARAGSVAIITKKDKAESNTNYAQGGIAAVMSQGDSFDQHIQDTLSTGLGLSHPEAVKIMVKEGPDRLRELMNLGVAFTTKGKQLDLAREGGHSHARIVHAQDLTGREIERALLDAIGRHPNIAIFENHIAIDLITEHHVKLKVPRDGTTCWGVYALNDMTTRVDTFLGKVVMLSTGGLGHVYLHTTNPPIATGDGIAMAFRAGADIANLEFIQFHPTTLYNSGSPSFLISEAVRGKGAILTDRGGRQFMEQYDQRGSLAPRDIVAYAIDTELKKSGEEFVLLDLRHLDPTEVQEHFPHIYTTCLQKFRVDITKEPIPVVPAAHYSCGGVVTSVYGETSIRGLYATGEVSMTGVHGANRLASNSLLEAVVFAERAVHSSVSFSENARSSVEGVREWDDSGTLNSEEWVLISHDRKEIQQIMNDYVGIVRSNVRLERARRRIEMIRDEIEQFYKKTKVTGALIELRNLALCAQLIIECARTRKESRGLHQTTDYPERDDDRFCTDTLLR